MCFTIVHLYSLLKNYSFISNPVFDLGLKITIEIKIQNISPNAKLIRIIIEAEEEIPLEKG